MRLRSGLYPIETATLDQVLRQHPQGVGPDAASARSRFDESGDAGREVSGIERMPLRIADWLAELLHDQESIRFMSP
jgi:hypothetical protein